MWELRSRKKSQPVRVLAEEFQIGTWRIVSTPDIAEPGVPVVVVVERIQ